MYRFLVNFCIVEVEDCWWFFGLILGKCKSLFDGDDEEFGF